MTQYIDKAVVVTEIERRINENKKDIQHATHKHLEEYFEGYEDALVLFKEKFIDTLEVKEIDSFIEKACRGIEHLLSGYIIRNFHFGDSYEMDTLIEDFKNYMKGE